VTEAYYRGSCGWANHDTHDASARENRYCVLPRLRILKLRTLVTRRVSEGKTGTASSLAYASGFHFSLENRQCATLEIAPGLFALTTFRLTAQGWLVFELPREQRPIL
jgi:hypothetical protein